MEFFSGERSHDMILGQIIWYKRNGDEGCARHFHVLLFTNISGMIVFNYFQPEIVD